MTSGKLEEISEEAANKGLIKGSEIRDYLVRNKGEIKGHTTGRNFMLPSYP